MGALVEGIDRSHVAARGVHFGIPHNFHFTSQSDIAV